LDTEGLVSENEFNSEAPASVKEGPNKRQRVTLMRPYILTYFVLPIAITFVPSVHAQMPLAKPESQGFSTERLNRIGPVMREEIAKGTMPGAVTLIARNGQIVHFEAHGYLDSGKTKPMPNDAIFRALSMTKPFVSVAAMMMVEQGKFQLRDPVANWLPELKEMKVIVEKKDAAGTAIRETEAAARPISVQDLLRHTSGFTYAGSAPYPEIREAYEKADFSSRETDVSPEEFIQRLAAIPLAYQPGTRWEDGVSTDVLGVLLERVGGKPLHVLLDEMIFKPLHMKDTSFQVTSSQLFRLADALDTDPMKTFVWKDARVEDDPLKRYRKAGGGTVTTAYDYFRFAQMVLNGGELDGVRLLSKKTVEYMLSDHIPGLAGSPSAATGPGYGFGLGFAIRRQDGFATAPGSTGDAMWAGFAGTSFTIDPREKIVGIFMAAAPTPRLHTRNLFKNLLYGAVVK
jgi:CubicO group peptidase (beta-lactamase class C family)